MKRIEEKVVPANADIVETIVRLAEEKEVWIYLSHSLVERLKKKYSHRDYCSEKGDIFQIDDSSDGKLFVDRGRVWNAVQGIPKECVYIGSDPEVIYFLS